MEITTSGSPNEDNHTSARLNNVPKTTKPIMIRAGEGVSTLIQPHPGSIPFHDLIFLDRAGKYYKIQRERAPLMIPSIV